VTIDEWVETLWKVLQVRPKIVHDYKRLYKRHLREVLGPYNFEEVSIPELQKKLLSLPPQTARHCLMLCKTIWREAENYGVTVGNPLGKMKTAPIQITPKKFLTWEQVDSLDWGRYNEQIRFLALHGLRWSEAAALTEADIHDNFVWVNRSVYGLCKSKTSVRRIPYLGHFKPFPKSYKPLQKAANAHSITVHSLRKTYAYLLKTQGIHVTTAQRLLGHSDPVLTMKIYTGVLDSEIDEAGEVLRKVRLASSM
jgi:integrase